MTWPFTDPDARVTDDYNVVRGNHLHRAWDVAARSGSMIVAPEVGTMMFLYMVRSGRPLPTVAESDRVLKRRARHFPWYLADRYGAVVVLFGETYWWLFSHCQVPETFRRAGDLHCHMEHGMWVDPDDASRRIEIYCNAHDEPLPAATEGQVLSFVGNSGYSTASHCHMEVILPGYEKGPTARVDPVEIFGRR
jgi:hypothetical protein